MMRKGGEMIRVMVVDDHSFVRAGLTEMLDAADGIQVVGECTDGAEVLERASAVRPDVVLMDQQMPVKCGTAATRDLLAVRPQSRVLMVTGSMSGRVLQEAAQAGAFGFILKGCDPRLLIEAVRTVASGATAWPADNGH
jgi:DNA-binding NarL/FixJ family response regulator